MTARLSDMAPGNLGDRPQEVVVPQEIDRPDDPEVLYETGHEARGQGVLAREVLSSQGPTVMCLDVTLLDAGQEAAIDFDENDPVSVKALRDDVNAHARPLGDHLYRDAVHLEEGPLLETGTTDTIDLGRRAVIGSVTDLQFEIGIETGKEIACVTGNVTLTDATEGSYLLYGCDG
jgi:hypothetical protein